MNVDFLAGMYGAKSRDRMSSIGDPKLAAKSGGGHAGLIVRDVQHMGIGHGAEQVADEAIEFGIGDEVSGLLLAKRSAKNTGEAEQRIVAAGKAIRSVA